MELADRMLRVQQREAGNPYKEGSDQWRAWASGWASGEVHAAMRFVKHLSKKRLEPQRGE